MGYLDRHLGTAIVGWFKEGVLGPLSLAGRGFGERFSGDPPEALRGIAEELRGLSHKLYRPAIPGQVPGFAPVAALNPATVDSASSTGNCGPDRLELKKHPLLLIHGNVPPRRLPADV